jgi:hypothetical protein
MNLIELEQKLSDMGIVRGSESKEDYLAACRELLWYNESIIDDEFVKWDKAIRVYVYGTLFSRDELEEILVDLGVNRCRKNKVGWDALTAIATFLNGFKKGSKEKRRCCNMIREILDRPLTPEEQEKINNGEGGFDDL